MTVKKFGQGGKTSKFLESDENPGLGIHTPDGTPTAIRHKVDRQPLLQIVLLMPPNRKPKAISNQNYQTLIINSHKIS